MSSNAYFFITIFTAFLCMQEAQGSYVQPPKQAFSAYVPEMEKRMHDASALVFDITRRADIAIRYAQRAITLQELTSASLGLKNAMDFVNNKTYEISRGQNSIFMNQIEKVRTELRNAYDNIEPRLFDAQKIVPSTY